MGIELTGFIFSSKLKLKQGDVLGSLKWGMLLASFWLLACQPKVKQWDSKFVDLYVELKIATVAYGNNLDKVNETRRVILAQHHYNPTKFHEQCQLIMANPAGWKEFQSAVVKKAEEFELKYKGGKDG